MTSIARPPETLEGWYALHQVLRIDAARRSDHDEIRERLKDSVARLEVADGAGWSALVELTAGSGEFLMMHFRATFDDLAVVRSGLREQGSLDGLEELFGMVSITEAGLYHATAELARAAGERGGSVGDQQYLEEMMGRRQAEASADHVKGRLYPAIPAGMPYVCFYPMSKRRATGQNWYGLTLDERSQLMRSHGETGRRYAGRVRQVITGAIGFSEWEWGVTLFAKDPLDFKKLITDMRFDEVSAKYAEFGPFFVGKLVGPAPS